MNLFISPLYNACLSELHEIFIGIPQQATINIMIMLAQEGRRVPNRPRCPGKLVRCGCIPYHPGFRVVDLLKKAPFPVLHVFEDLIG